MDASPGESSDIGIPFSQVLRHELRQVEIRREKARSCDDPPAPGPLETMSPDSIASEEELREEALEKSLVGLAFSGGGIRSATFNLGVLQALADFNLLKHVDYLSTVSGGGYIGSWLAAWIKREGDAANVTTELKSTRADQSWAQRSALQLGKNGVEAVPLEKGLARSEEPAPIEHLRAHTNYLAPKLGIFSADVWVLGAIYLRNFVLNQAVLLPAILVVLLAARLLFSSFLREHAPWWNLGCQLFGIFAFTALAMAWIIYTVWRLREIGLGRGTRKIHFQLNSRMLHVLVLLPLLIASVLICRIFVSKGQEGVVSVFLSAANTRADSENQVAVRAESWPVRSVQAGALAGILFGVIAAICLLAAFARLLWRGQWPSRATVGRSALGTLLWLGLSVLSGFFGGLVAFVPLAVFDEAIDLSSSNLQKIIYMPMALGVTLGALHLLGCLLYVLLTANEPAAAEPEGRADGPQRPPAIFETSQPSRILEVCRAWRWGRLVRCVTLGVLTGFWGFLLLLVFQPLAAGLHIWLQEEPYWFNAVSFGLFVGLVFGWAHLYYLFILLVRFLRDCWRESRNPPRDGDPAESFLTRYWKRVGLHGALGWLVFLTLAGFAISITCIDAWMNPGEIAQWHDSKLGLALVVLITPPALLAGCLLRWKCPPLREMPWWLLAGLLAGVLGGTLIFMLGDAIYEHGGPWPAPPNLGASAVGFAMHAPGPAVSWVATYSFINQTQAWPDGPFSLALVVVFGPPMVLGIIMLMIALEIGLLGRYLPESIREWLGSLCGWLLIYAAMYIIIVGIALFGGWLLTELGPWAQAALGTAWFGTAIGGVLAGRSPKTGSTTGVSRLDLLAKIAPYVFLAGLLALLSLLVTSLVDDPPTWDHAKGRVAELQEPKEPAIKVKSVARSDGKDPPIETRSQEYTLTKYEAAIRREQFWQAMGTTKTGTLLGWLAGCAALAAVMAWRVDVNVFSLSALYGNRLIRCYLGASRAKIQARGAAPIKCDGGDPLRQPNPVTGLDGLDDFPLRHLTIGPVSKEMKDFDHANYPDHDRREYDGPYLLVNAALNLVRPDNLAWQERMAESFVFTPAYCGSASTGYQPLMPVPAEPQLLPHIQKQRDRLTLGHAVTVSGAAASPNMGYHSSPAVTALMTVFNARLGAWLRNPAPLGLTHSLRKLLPDWNWLKSWTKWVWVPEGPPTGLWYLAAELLGLTGSDRSYVYLSDGGHFENLGVYELVRRRCRFVIACDAGADPGYDFEDLAGLIRKCRTDFGVRIEMDVSPLKPEGTSRNSRWHCAIGLIRYDDVDSRAVPGILVYIKASMSGDEPSDVQNLAAAHPSFPHQSTMDQFFTESQFESYRALGHHIAQKVFADAVSKMQDPECADHKGSAKTLFTALRRRWFPPPPDHEKNFLESMKAFVDAQHDLRTDKHLRRLSTELYPEFSRIPEAHGEEIATRPPDAQPAIPDVPNALLAFYAVRQTAGNEVSGIAGLHMVAQMLQVMEQVWLNIQLEGYYAHPLNRGWMNVFRRWSSSSVFRRYWPILRGEFSQDFVRFCDDQLSLGAPKVKALRVNPLADVAAQRAIQDDLVKTIAGEWPELKNRNRLSEWHPRPARRFVPIKALQGALEEAQKAVAKDSPEAGKELDSILEQSPLLAEGSRSLRSSEIKDAFEKVLPNTERWLGLEPLDDFIREVHGTAGAEIDGTLAKDRFEVFRHHYVTQWSERQAELQKQMERLREVVLDKDSVEVIALEQALATLRKAINRKWPNPLREACHKIRDLHLDIVAVDIVQPILRQAFEDFEELLKTSAPARKHLNELRRLLGHWHTGTAFPWRRDDLDQRLQSIKQTFMGNRPAPERRRLADLFEQKAKESLGLIDSPPVWLIPLPHHPPLPESWSEGEYPCGMIRLLDDPQSAQGSYEVFVWLRGAYRNLGIGRQCIEKPLDEIWESIENAEMDCLGNIADFTLKVRYPNGALPASGDKLERAMWLSFFFDYDFRRRKLPPDQADPDLILERCYRSWRQHHRPNDRDHPAPPPPAAPNQPTKGNPAVEAPSDKPSPKSALIVLLLFFTAAELCT